MSGQDQDTAGLEERWKELVKETFEDFARTEIGLDSEGRPACFGSGDNKEFCIWCDWQPYC